MTLAFLFDVKLYKYNNHYYSVNLSKKLWESRYMPYFNEIYVICRYVDTNENVAEKYHLTDEKGVTVYAHCNNGPMARIIHSSEVSKNMIEILKKSDTAICRNGYGVRECQKVGIPYMIENISCSWDSMWNHSLMGKLSAPFFYVKQKEMNKNAPYVLYVSEKFLQSRYPTNGKNVGVSDVIITPMTEREKELRLSTVRGMKSKKVLKIGTTAAVNVKYKGQRFVIEALAILKKKGIDCFEYHLAGSGDQTALKKTAEKFGVSDKIVFYGNVKHDEINNILDSWDIYIQPSLQEGLPRALVEAMSRGLICIGANTGGIPELLEDKWICYNKKRLPEEIATKLMDILENDEIIKSVEYNINRSDDFRKEKLDEKRDRFMKDFIEYAKKYESGKK